VSRKSAFFFAVTLAIFGRDVFASDQLKGPEILASYVDTKTHPIQIDGATDDWAPAMLQHQVHFYPGDNNPGSPERPATTVVQKMDGRKDGDVRVCLAHDGTCLYLLAVIQDDLLEQRTAETNKNEAYMEDCLHIYIDSANVHAHSVENPPLLKQPGYEQFGVSTDYNVFTESCDFTTHNGKKGSAEHGAQPDQNRWLVKVKILGNGPYTYIFEERMPLSEVPGHNLRTMVPGKTYGFNAEFCDSDAGVFLEGYIFWSSDGKTDAYISEDLWGRLTLEPLLGKTQKRG
jgi:hypothetical protein